VTRQLGLGPKNVASDSRGPANKLLRRLEPSAYRRLGPKLKPRTLRAKQTLYKPNEPIHTIYFPEDSVICQMTVMPDGRTIETGTVGLEGASWISASIGAPSMPSETIVAIGGLALMLRIDELEHELRENEPFRHVLTRYSHALLVHSMRITGCTGLHTLEQRCARWILTTLDRVSEDRFSITHEFLAMLLGASRPAVSIVIEDFQRNGMLRHQKGRVLIGDRGRLATVACECYEVIRRSYEPTAGEIASLRPTSRRDSRRDS
jgi:CRP-like cAMP-binding protein